MLRLPLALRFAPRAVVAWALIACAGCHWTLTDTGTDPKSYQFDFPTGIAVDPSGQFVYIANANGSLAYGGGTLMMADMVRFECAVARFRQCNEGATPLAVCDLPAASTCPSVTHPPALTALKGVDFDVAAAQCQYDPFDPTIVDCDEGQFLLQNSTVKIGNFAGEIRLKRDDIDARHRTLYVAVRGDPSVTWVDVRFPSGVAGSVPKDISKPGVLQCVDNPATLEQNPTYDAKANTTLSPPGCDKSHLVQEYLCEHLPNCIMPTASDNMNQLPTEPFGIQLDQSTAGAAEKYARLLVSNQSSGQVTLIDVLGMPNLLNVSAPFFQPDQNGNHGAFGLAQQHRHDPSSDWYLTSNLFALADTFRIAEANIVLPESQISLQSTFAFGNDIRDIQFEASGDRAFISEANPPALLTFDTRIISGPNGGLPQNQVTGAVDVCQTPSHTAVRHFYVQGAPGEPPVLVTRVYVVCFLSSQVMIVDPDLGTVVDTIYSGFGGPNEIAFNFAGTGADPEDVIMSPLPQRAYVTNFTESTIAVVDLEPGSPMENRVIARLGFPPTKMQP
jgi:hypothetical protein